jgi:hypothetical protein
MDAQTDDDLGLTSSPLAGIAAAVAPTAPTAVTDPKVVDPKVVTAPKVAPTVTTNRFTPTVNPVTGAVTDRLGNPVVTDAQGWGYFDAKTGLAVSPATDKITVVAKVSPALHLV